MNNIATVLKSTGNWYTISFDDVKREKARLKGKIRLSDIKNTNPIAVGDKVIVEKTEEGEYLIKEILPRNNYIIRKSINLSKQNHIIAANIDQAIIVVAITKPRTAFGFIDRFLLTTSAYQIPTIIVINKKDIYSYDELNTANYYKEIYESLGYKVSIISALNKESVEELKIDLMNKLTVICGHSGSGKSTLLNALDNNLQLRTSSISSYNEKGKHTTTFAEMLSLSFNAKIIDTPGIKELGITDMKKEEVKMYFKEIFNISSYCKFNNCNHINEPGCAVIKGVEDGKIYPSRYNSYLTIFTDELEND